jgi:hypothetical protein
MGVKKPQVIIDWENNRPLEPHVCFNCWNYDSKGKCEIFEEVPPDDFLEESGACNKWEQAIPF